MRSLVQTSFLAATAAFVVSACQTSVPGGFTTPPGSTNVVAKASGFTFPPKVGEFVRVGTTQYDSGGQDVSVKYEAGKLVILDVYNYPAGTSLTSEVQARKIEIKTLHPDARVASEATITIRPGGQSHTGSKIVFFFSQNFRSDVGGPYKSQLLLFKENGRFVKFRATYPQAHAERAEAIIKNFVNGLPWPDR